MAETLTYLLHLASSRLKSMEETLTCLLRLASGGNLDMFVVSGFQQTEVEGRDRDLVFLSVFC